MWVTCLLKFSVSKDQESYVHNDFRIRFHSKQKTVHIIMIIILRYTVRHFAAGGTTPKQTGRRRRHRTAADESSEILQLYLQSSANIEADPRRLLNIRKAQR